MAKSGQIQLLAGLSFGTEPLADSVVFTESTPSNLGGVVADLLENSSDPLRVLVDPINRKVYAFPVATDVEALLTGTLKSVGVITRDDATKRSSPVTMADGDDVSGDANVAAMKGIISGSFGEVKPSKNVGAIVNSVEDAIAQMASGSDPITVDNIMVLVDQTGDGSVKVISGATGLVATGAVAKIQQVLQSTSTTPALAFE